MSTIEEAREQAREALADYHRVNAGGYGAGHHASLARALRALLDATEPQEAVEPTEDEREALRFTPELRADLVEFARVRIQAVWDDVGETDAATLAQNVVLAQEFAWLSMHFPTKGPRPITDEMVEAARKGWQEAHGRTGPGARMRAALEAAEEARR